MKMFIAICIFALSSITNAAVEKYSGQPFIDKNFNIFIEKNNHKNIYLHIYIDSESARSYITDGYRGVQPSFDAAPLNGIDYSYFLNCDGIIDGEVTKTIDKCGDFVTWNESRGVLSGYFYVSDIFKTKMKKYRGVTLVPTNNTDHK